MKRFTITILTLFLLLLATVVFTTWQYRLGCLLLCIIANREWLLTKVSASVYRIVLIVVATGILIAIPNYFQRGRTQIIYIDSNGNSRTTPLGVYLTNVVFPEEEIMNFGVKLNAILPPSRNRLAADAHHDF